MVMKLHHSISLKPEQKVTLNALLNGEDVFIVSLLDSEKFYLPDICSGNRNQLFDLFFHLWRASIVEDKIIKEILMSELAFHWLSLIPTLTNSSRILGTPSFKLLLLLQKFVLTTASRKYWNKNTSCRILHWSSCFQIYRISSCQFTWSWRMWQFCRWFWHTHDTFWIWTWGHTGISVHVSCPFAV